MNLLAAILDLKLWKFVFIDTHVDDILEADVLEDCPLSELLVLVSISSEEAFEKVLFVRIFSSTLNALYFWFIFSLLVVSWGSFIERAAFESGET